MDYVNFASFDRTSDFASDRGSNLCRYSSAVVEQLTCNQQVPSSTLGGGTTFSLSGELSGWFERRWLWLDIHDGLQGRRGLERHRPAGLALR